MIRVLPYYDRFDKEDWFALSSVLPGEWQKENTWNIDFIEKHVFDVLFQPEYEISSEDLVGGFPLAILGPEGESWALLKAYPQKCFEYIGEQEVV